MKKIALILSFALPVFAQAQQVRPVSSAQIYHEIAQLKNLTNVLYVAAHPDDENTRFLAWMVNEENIHTAYLSLTRGDGGQNILGTEQGAALGYIRTHELLEARKLDGAEQFFTRAIDFGFSKNYTETFKHWDAQQLTSDVVWVMRKYRPDVVICRFPPNEMAGHGQHAASAIIALKAFEAAGSKTMYTDQLKHYKAWQPKRILQNTYRFGDRNTTAEDQFKLPVGQYSSLLGMGYGELAGISRSIHKSQGAGTPSTPGIQTEYFKHVGGEKINTSLFDGIDITWNRVKRPEIGEHIKTILKEFNFKRPERALPELLGLRKEIETVKNSFWRKQKLAELDEIILHCTGLMAEVYTKQPEAIAGNTLPFTLRVLARTKMPVYIERIDWISSDTNTNIRLANDSLFSTERAITIPVNTAVTEPYWLSKTATNAGQFAIPFDTLLGLPETPNTLNVSMLVRVGDWTTTVKVPLSYKKLDPVKGDVVEQLRIEPDVTIDFTSQLLIATADGAVQTAIRIHPEKAFANATLVLNGGDVSQRISGLRLRKGVDTLINVTIHASNHKEDYILSAKLEAGNNSYNKSRHLIQYDHIPTLQHFSPAAAKVVHTRWKSTAKRIGYIQGAGDYVAELLRLTGLQVDVLKDADMNAEKLKKYDAIITGIRAVNTEKKMVYWMPALLRYVENGGTLVMQYNTLQDLATTNLGPYPFTLSSQRVTEEDAQITFLKPQHKLLNHPNKISGDDMNDWVQERGLYFPTKWDDRYQTIFEMKDTDEKPQQSATLYTPYGKGHYIYTSLSFFRQLPAGNAGAMRLLMNMISAGK